MQAGSGLFYLCHSLLRAQRAVAVHVLNVVFERRVSVVDEVAMQRARCTGALHRFMHRPLFKPCCAFAEEPQLRIGIVAAMPYPAAEK